MTVPGFKARRGTAGRHHRSAAALRFCPRLGVGLFLAVSLAAPNLLADDLVVIKAGRIHTVAGDPIEDGMIVVRDGKIAAVGRDVAIPDGARVLDYAGSVVTPGLVDACCAIGFEIPQASSRWLARAPETQAKSFWTALCEGEPTPEEPPHRRDPNDLDEPLEVDGALAAGQSPAETWADHSAEVTPHRFVLDSVNLLSNDFTRLARGGVTTVYLTPDSANVIGGRGAIVKTAGPLDQRIVRRADAVKATLGSDPSRRGRRNYLPPHRGPMPSFHTRRPTTRMGVDWVFRKAFYDAQRVRDGLEPHGADTAPAPAFPVLQQILAGEVPLRIQARMQHDIFSALRLANEFNLNFILEEATEAYRCLPQLEAAGMPVIFGPIFMTPDGYRQYSGEADSPRLTTAKQLADRGIELALTAQELRDEEGLVRQGMFAVRHGLSPDETLRAITATPATLMGLAGQIGVVAPGAAADLVVWSTEPFDATSRPLLVMIDGRVVVDR